MSDVSCVVPEKITGAPDELGGTPLNQFGPVLQLLSPPNPVQTSISLTVKLMVPEPSSLWLSAA